MHRGALAAFLLSGGSALELLQAVVIEFSDGVGGKGASPSPQSLEMRHSKSRIMVCEGVERSDEIAAGIFIVHGALSIHVRDFSTNNFKVTAGPVPKLRCVCVPSVVVHRLHLPCNKLCQTNTIIPKATTSICNRRGIVLATITSS